MKVDFKKSVLLIIAVAVLTFANCSAVLGVMYGKISQISIFAMLFTSICVVLFLYRYIKWTRYFVDNSEVDRNTIEAITPVFDALNYTVDDIDEIDDIDDDLDDSGSSFDGDDSLDGDGLSGEDY